MTNTTHTQKQELEDLRLRVSQLEAIEAKRLQAEAELRARVHQQEVVANLGLRALTGIELATLFNEAAVLVTQTLNVKFCQILELLPDRDILLLRAGAGWKAGLVGQATVDAQAKSHVGYTLFSSEPVIVQNLSTDNRFTESSLLHQHGVVSGVSVIIDGEEWPFGVLSMHTDAPRTFTKDDINFLQAVANVLAIAVAHKRAQKALQDARDELERRVKERTAELQTANDELKTFTYTVSHDLRAPLVNIKGFTGELGYALEDVRAAIEPALPHLNGAQQQTITRAFQEDIPEAMGFIDSSVDRMNHFITAILKLSRLGYRTLTFEPVNLEVLVHATLGTLAHQIEQRRVQVTVQPLPTIYADRTSMEQIIGNILTNAVVYLKPDRPGKIEISGEDNHDETIIKIRDNGRGIAADDMHKVFEPFRRAGKQDVPGEGIGLTYVRALVRRQNGRIWCESEFEKGTTFAFALPHNYSQGEDYV